MKERYSELPSLLASPLLGRRRARTLTRFVKRRRVLEFSLDAAAVVHRIIEISGWEGVEEADGVEHIRIAHRIRQLR